MASEMSFSVERDEGPHGFRGFMVVSFPTDRPHIRNAEFYNNSRETCERYASAIREIAAKGWEFQSESYRGVAEHIAFGWSSPAK